MSAPAARHASTAARSLSQLATTSAAVSERSPSRAWTSRARTSRSPLALAWRSMLLVGDAPAARSLSTMAIWPLSTDNCSAYSSRAPPPKRGGRTRPPDVSKSSTMSRWPSALATSRNPIPPWRDTRPTSAPASSSRATIATWPCWHAMNSAVWSRSASSSSSSSLLLLLLLLGRLSLLQRRRASRRSTSASRPAEAARASAIWGVQEAERRGTPGRGTPGEMRGLGQWLRRGSALGGVLEASWRSSLKGTRSKGPALRGALS